MERWRWLPDLAADRIEVDVTAFELTAYRDNRAGLSSRVVVGEPGMRTPILATATRTMTLNPPWNIPTSIIRNEILPRVRRNPNFLASQRVRIVKGSLDNPNTLQLQQSPGPMAALGKIKLEMPNPFDVYLHDTPTKAPFARAYRAVSHGCVRVQEIFALGSFLLRGDTRSGLERINSVVATGGTRSLALPKPFAVYMLYWTVIPDANGALAFRQDLYGRDTRMIAAMGDMAVSAIPPDAAGNPT
jgi:murein L,D-transpeptidase YcbB/YkuD